MSVRDQETKLLDSSKVSVMSPGADSRTMRDGWEQESWTWKGFDGRNVELGTRSYRLYTFKAVAGAKIRESIFPNYVCQCLDTLWAHNDLWAHRVTLSDLRFTLYPTPLPVSSRRVGALRKRYSAQFYSIPVSSHVVCRVVYSVPSDTMLAESPLEVREREIKTEFLLRIGKELNDRRAALTKQLKETDQSLTGLWAEYGALHNSSVYINRLPMEILQHIFSLCLNVPRLAGDGYYVYEEERPRTEVVLSHICHHWRVVAVNDPLLWRSFRYKTPRWKHNPITRFSTYLERSSPIPVDLFIHINSSSQEDMTILDAAALQVHRWRRATIISEDNNFKWGPFQAALMGKEATELEYFSFRPSMQYVSAYVHSGHVLPVSCLRPKIFTLGAPKLARVHLDSTVPYFFLPPLSNVSTFSLDAKYVGPSSVTWQAFLDIIALPSLQSLSIGGDVLLAPTHERSNQPIQAKTLKHLRWSGDRDSLDHFLSYLSAPKLETLILCRMHLPPRPTHSNATLSLPSLHSLYVIECANLSANYIQFLASGCPNIKHLSMSYYRPESGHLLGYLNGESEEGRALWEGLESITAHIDGAHTVDPYLTFVQARKRAGHRFTLRVSNRLHLSWLTHLADSLVALQQDCDVVPWTSAADILPAQWPPGGNVCVSQYDRSSQFNFAVDWNEF